MFISIPPWKKAKGAAEKRNRQQGFRSPAAGLTATKKRSPQMCVSIILPEQAKYTAGIWYTGRLRLTLSPFKSKGAAGLLAHLFSSVSVWDGSGITPG
jgi:hypothetical protein